MRKEGLSVTVEQTNRKIRRGEGKLLVKNEKGGREGKERETRGLTPTRSNDRDLRELERVLSILELREEGVEECGREDVVARSWVGSWEGVRSVEGGEVKELFETVFVLWMRKERRKRVSDESSEEGRR